jgi:hypothetical protein
MSPSELTGNVAEQGVAALAFRPRTLVNISLDRVLTDGDVISVKMLSDQADKRADRNCRPSMSELLNGLVLGQHSWVWFRYS